MMIWTYPNNLGSDPKKNRYKICVEALKDYSAHYKFMKKSGMRFRREIKRSDFPKGPEGWRLWQMQFTPQEGEDTTAIENALNNLRSQGKIKESECARLKLLYGLDEQKTQQIAYQYSQIPVTLPPEPQTTMNPCPRCGASLRWIQQYQRWYCDQEKTYI